MLGRLLAIQLMAVVLPAQGPPVMTIFCTIMDVLSSLWRTPIAYIISTHFSIHFEANVGRGWSENEPVPPVSPFWAAAAAVKMAQR